MIFTAANDHNIFFFETFKSHFCLLKLIKYEKGSVEKFERK